MKMNKMVPIITVSSFDDVKAFYQRHFGLKVTYEAERYLGLSPENRDCIEIAFIKPDDDEQSEFNGQGLMYCFEVDDVDAEYARLKSQSVTILNPVQDNPWGDRSFVVSAPHGVSLYIYSPIPPAEEYKQYHKS